jgi:hypothetical protein
MQIAPPFGYKEVVTFQKTHKIRLPAPGAVPAFIERSNAVPISFTEFPVVAREYPIVFAGSEQGKPPAAVAVLGLTAAENLYVRDGAWQAGAYVPAYVRRYPFCMARLPQPATGQPSHVICVEREFVDERGEALFDAEGRPGGRWPDIQRLLSEYEADLDRTRGMCTMLADYGLLEPFTMQATLAKERGGATMQLTGMQRVGEKLLENLNAAQLKNLIRTGVMARLYVHLLSLENFSRLLERKAAGAPA